MKASGICFPIYRLWKCPLGVDQSICPAILYDVWMAAFIKAVTAIFH